MPRREKSAPPASKKSFVDFWRRTVGGLFLRRRTRSDAQTFFELGRNFSTWAGMPADDGRLPALVVGTFSGGFHNDDAQHGFSSRHNGEAKFLFGDDSVKFVSETIDDATVKALVTRAGAESVSF